MNTHESFVQIKFKQVARFIPENSKILDIGCGDCDIRNFLKNSDYYGLDGNYEHFQNLVKQGIKAKQVDFNKDKIGDPFVIVITTKGISCLTWNSVSGYQPITNSKECEAIMEKLKKAPPSPKSPLYKKPLKNYKR